MNWEAISQASDAFCHELLDRMRGSGVRISINLDLFAGLITFEANQDGHPARHQIMLSDLAKAEEPGIVGKEIAWKVAGRFRRHWDDRRR